MEFVTNNSMDLKDLVPGGFGDLYLYSRSHGFLALL